MNIIDSVLIVGFYALSTTSGITILLFLYGIFQAKSKPGIASIVNTLVLFSAFYNLLLYVSFIYYPMLMQFADKQYSLAISGLYDATNIINTIRLLAFEFLYAPTILLIIITHFVMKKKPNQQSYLLNVTVYMAILSLVCLIIGKFIGPISIETLVTP